MKYLKASACSILAILLYSSIESAENDHKQLWESLKAKVSKRPLPKKQVESSALKGVSRNDQIMAGIVEIEKSIFEENAGLRLPKVFAEFHQQVGDRNFAPISFYSPIGGDESSLYRLIREGQEKQIPFEWIAFGKVDEDEYYCINHKTGAICIYLVHPVLEKDASWTNLPTLLKEKWLSH